MGDRVRLIEATIPPSLDGPDGEAFREMVAVRNAVEEEAVGSIEFSPTAEELLPVWQNTVDKPKRLLLARADGRVVGRGTVELPPEEGSATAFVAVEVLPDYRDAGIGTALLEGERRGRRERLESLEREALQVHACCPFADRTRSSGLR